MLTILQQFKLTAVNRCNSELPEENEVSATEVEENVESVGLKKRTRKHENKKETEDGIIYMSHVPKFMSVKRVRQMMAQYGEIGRIFLQPSESQKDRKNRTFSEGWIEFLDKKKAKRVALSLNNTQIGGKRSSPWYWELWNIKYLSRFKWAHLNERLAYEKAVHEQRLRTEITQAKREANFYVENVEKKKIFERIERKEVKQGGILERPLEIKEWNFSQSKTENEILSGKRKLSDKDLKKRQKQVKVQKLGMDDSFLKSLFSKEEN